MAKKYLDKRNERGQSYERGGRIDERGGRKDER
jgi:uncharacterized Zn finger protein